jgi:hypothetical protein
VSRSATTTKLVLVHGTAAIDEVGPSTRHFARQLHRDGRRHVPLLVIEHVAMPLSMVAAMLLRPAEYTRGADGRVEQRVAA